MAGTLPSPVAGPGSTIARPSSFRRLTVVADRGSRLASSSWSSGNRKSKSCSAAGAATANPRSTSAARSDRASWACRSWSGVADDPCATRGIAGGSHTSQAPAMPRWSVFGDQPPQQRLGGPDYQLAVVGDHDVVAAPVLGPVVAEVVGDQGGREPGADHDQVPLAAQGVVGGQVGPPDPGDRGDRHAVAEGAGERRPGGQELIAAPGGRGELAGVLEGGQQDVGLGRVQALVLQLHAGLGQHLLGGPAG